MELAEQSGLVIGKQSTTTLNYETVQKPKEKKEIFEFLNRKKMYFMWKKN